MDDKTITTDPRHVDPADDRVDSVQPGLDGLLGDEEASGPSVGSVGREALKRGSDESKVDDTSKDAGT